MTIENSHGDGSYSTVDTAMAAWLYSQGFELTDVDFLGFPSVFYFENSSFGLKEAIRAYQLGKAEGNIVTFYRAYKKMLSMVKVGKL